MKLNNITNIVKSGFGVHPADIIMLNCDAFAVFSLIS